MQDVRYNKKAIGSQIKVHNRAVPELMDYIKQTSIAVKVADIHLPINEQDVLDYIICITGINTRYSRNF